MLKEIYEKAISNNMTEKDAVYILSLNSERLPELFFYSDSLRRHFKGNRIEICSIINVKSGNCPEDCAFCAQSAYSKVKINEYPLLGVKEMIKAACLSKSFHSKKFSIVLSRRKLSNRKEVKRIKEAGLHTYHCNLETSKNFFRNICTTHSYEDKIETIKMAKRLGFYVCSDHFHAKICSSGKGYKDMRRKRRGLERPSVFDVFCGGKRNNDGKLSDKERKESRR